MRFYIIIEKKTLWGVPLPGLPPTKGRAQARPRRRAGFQNGSPGEPFWSARAVWVHRAGHRREKREPSRATSSKPRGFLGARRPPGKSHAAKVPEPSLQSGGCKKRGRRNTVCIARTSDTADALCSRGKRGWGSAAFTQRAVPRASEVAVTFSVPFWSLKKEHSQEARTSRFATLSHKNSFR